MNKAIPLSLNMKKVIPSLILLINLCACSSPAPVKYQPPKSDPPEIRLVQPAFPLFTSTSPPTVQFLTPSIPTALPSSTPTALPTLTPTALPQLTPALQTISWDRAAEFAGQWMTVCGPVISAKFAQSSKGKPTFLNIGNSYPNPNRMQVVIWIEHRSNFKVAPETYYLGKEICVEGNIEIYRGVPEIEVRGPS